MTKSFSVFMIVICIVLTLAVLGTAGLGVLTYLKVAALESSAAEQSPEGSVEGEDDIEIAGGYMIRSTKAISDAYISGDSTSLSEKDKETLDMASAVLDEIITDGMSDYDKEKAVFEWMNKNIGGSADVTVLVRDDNSEDNPHGVLTSRVAVCVGYATTFRLFMQMLDIPCMVVHSDDLVHTWDLAQIDGHWYHVDLYSAQGVRGALQYLNRDDRMALSGAYTWDGSFYPAADSLDRSYIYMNAVKAKDVYGIPDAVRKAIEDHTGFASVIVPNGDNVPDLAEGMLNAIEEKLINSAEYQDYSFAHSVTETSDGSLLAYIMVYDYTEDEEPDDSLTDEERENIDSAITDAFGELTEIGYDYY